MGLPVLSPDTLVVQNSPHVGRSSNSVADYTGPVEGHKRQGLPELDLGDVVCRAARVKHVARDLVRKRLPRLRLEVLALETLQPTPEIIDRRRRRSHSFLPGVGIHSVCCNSYRMSDGGMRDRLEH